jgi:DNA-binding response OmpR family regulator
MQPQRREKIDRSLRVLAESYRSMMEVMENTLALLCEELHLDPLTYLKTRPTVRAAHASGQNLAVDPGLLSVTFRGKVCFLGNTLPFRFLYHLAQRPNRYVDYEELLAEVWQGTVSDSAVRSVVKTLRRRLRRAGLPDLAEAIDGTARGHYALKLLC